jgi:hypothetical protein
MRHQSLSGADAGRSFQAQEAPSHEVKSSPFSIDCTTRRFADQDEILGPEHHSGCKG